MTMYSSAEHRKLVKQLMSDRKLKSITDRFARMDHLVKHYSKKLIRHSEWVQAQCHAYEAEHQKTQSSAKYFLAKTDHYIRRLQVADSAEAYDEAYGKMMEKSNRALCHLAYRWSDPLSMVTLAKLYAKRAEVNVPVEQYALAKANLKLAYSAVLTCQADKLNFQQAFDLQLLATLVSLGSQLVLVDQKEDKDKQKVDYFLSSPPKSHKEALSLIEQLNAQLEAAGGKKNTNKGIFRLNSKIKLVKSGVSGGRFYQATGHIAPNERILRDQSQSTTIFQEHRFSYCDMCHRSMVSINGESIFWPCSDCTEMAYCSGSCAKNAYEQHHRFECGIYGLIVGEEDFYWMSHVYRHYVLFGVDEAMAAENEEVAVEYGSAKPFDLNEYINSEEHRNKPLKQLSTSGRQLLCRAMTALETNRGKRSPLREHTNSVLSFYIVNFFLYKGVLSEDLVQMMKNSTAFGQLLENLSASMMRVSTNGFCWADDISEEQFIRVASCVCLAASFLNHNCNANVTWSMSDGAKITMTAIRAIEPGEALTTCYGPKEHHLFSDRQERLYNDYCFYCHCEVCLKDAANFPDTLQCTDTIGCRGPLVQKPFHACLQCGQQGERSVSDRLVGLVKEASAEFERIYLKLYKKKRGPLVSSLIKKLLQVAGQKKKKKAGEGDSSDHVRKLMLQLEPEVECSLRLQKAILGNSEKLAANAFTSSSPKVPIELNADKFTLSRLFALEKEMNICAQLSYSGSYHLLEKYVALLKVYQDAGLAERGLQLMKTMSRSLQNICPSLTDASLAKLVALLDYANYFFESFALAHKDDIPRLMGEKEASEGGEEEEDEGEADSQAEEKSDGQLKSSTKGEHLFWSTFQRFNSKLESILQYDIEHRGDFCPLYHQQLHQHLQQDVDVFTAPTADLNEQYFLQLYRESKRRAVLIEEAIANFDQL